MAADVERAASSDIGDLLPAARGGIRLSRDECLRLWHTTDLTSLGVLANLARERVSGNNTYFRPVLHVNPTNRPDPACPECTAVASRRVLPDAPEDSGTDVRGELHLTGGADPEAGVDELCQLVEKASKAFPRIRLRAFTWQQLESAAAKDRLSPGQVLSRLVEAGLAALAGGALVDLTPSQPNLTSVMVESAERRTPWIQAACELHLKCELSWIIGEGDDPEILTDLLTRMRDIQDIFKVFECLLPLLFRWPSDALELPIPTGYNQLRAVAIGRLFLDNISRICCSPFAVSEPMAQVAQWYGADDAGGTNAGVNRESKSILVERDRMIRLMREAGRDPVEI